MYLAGLSPQLSNILGYSIGLVTSYALNRTFTFRSRNRKPAEFTRFLVIFGVSFAVNFVVLTLLLRVQQIPAGVSQVIAGAAYVVTSYVLGRRYVFRPHRG
jgi:putative flippase GtrA